MQVTTVGSISSVRALRMHVLEHETMWHCDYERCGKAIFLNVAWKSTKSHTGLIGHGYVYNMGIVPHMRTILECTNLTTWMIIPRRDKSVMYVVKHFITAASLCTTTWNSTLENIYSHAVITQSSLQQRSSKSSYSWGYPSFPLFYMLI